MSHIIHRSLRSTPAGSARKARTSMIQAVNSIWTPAAVLPFPV